MHALSGHSNRARALSVVAAGILAATTASCGGSDTGRDQTAPTSPGATSGTVVTGDAIVEVKNFTFTPPNLTVSVGTKVTWKFDDAAKHNVVADDKTFTSEILSNGQTYTYTFTKAGSYPYICTIHPYMKGTITVQ